MDKKETSKASKEARTQELNDVVALMDRADGRRFIWRILSIAGVYRSSMTGNSQTFFNEGKREVGLRLLDDIHRACPDTFIKMMQEQQNVRRDTNHPTD